MKDKNKLQDSILWHDGMMLTAEHFEQLTGRLEKIIWYHTQLIKPYYWGVTNIEIDETLLTHGRLAITKLDAILPDGLIIHISPENQDSPQLDLARLFSDNSQKTVKICLLVPPESDDNASDSTGTARYKQVKPQIINNETNQDSNDDIPLRRPNVLLQSIEDLENIDSAVPLVQIAYSNGQFLKTEFIPPTLNVLPQSPIWKIVSGIIQKVKMKSIFLANQITQFSVLYEPIILDKRFLLQNLTASLPMMETILQSGNVHPYQLYLSLCSLLGHLSTLGFELTMENTVIYDHNDLNNTFIQFRNLIFRILDESIGEKYHAIPFDRQGSAFRIKVNKQWLDQPLIIGITIKVDKTENDVFNWMSNCLIGSEDEIIRMRKQRTLGIQRKRIVKDSNFPATLDTVFFSLEPQSVKPDQALVILNPSDYLLDLIPTNISLYVRRKFEL